MFFRSVSARVYHLSSRLIVYELCPPPLSIEVREPKKRAVSVTRMAFGAGDRVKIVNSVLNIKLTDQAQAVANSSRGYINVLLMHILKYCVGKG